MKKYFFVILYIFFLTFVNGCKEENDDNDEIINENIIIEIIDEKKELLAGEKYYFNFDTNVIITTSDNKIVDVNNDEFFIIGIEEGTATITVTSTENPDIYDTVIVEVYRQEEVTGEVKIEYDSLIYLGEYGKVKVTSTYPNDIITIESLSKNVVEIDQSLENDMFAKAIGTGVAMIRIANKYGFVKIIYISVEKKSEYEVKSLELEIVDEGPYYMNESYQLKVTVDPIEALERIKFYISPQDGVIDEETLIVTIKKAGSITIRCYCDIDYDLTSSVTFEADFNPNIEMYDLLFIGNSLTYFKYSIPDFISKMIKLDGIQVNIAMDSITPQWIIDHESAFNTFIQQRKYTHVILQEYSYGLIQDYNKFETSVLKFNEKIIKNGAQLVLYQTWAYNTDIYNGKTKDQFLETIVNGYNSVALMTNAIVSRAGEAFMYYEKNYEGYPSLYYDINHPNVYGAFLSACVHYATITGRKASDNSFLIEEVEEDIAIVLKSVADMIVFN